jgi:hypothetical protein
MFNPLVGSLRELSLEDLISKINDLHTKLGQSNRFGNYHLANQIRATLNMHQEEYQRRMAEESEKAKNNKIIKDKVDIKK